MYPANFRKIQAYLEWKSLQDCINYYYTNKYSARAPPLLPNSARLLAQLF